MSSVFLLLAAVFAVLAMHPALPAYNGLHLLAVIALILSAVARLIESHRDRKAADERHNP
jgi:cell division protein FtsL